MLRKRVVDKHLAIGNYRRVNTEVRDSRRPASRPGAQSYDFVGSYVQASDGITVPTCPRRPARTLLMDCTCNYIDKRTATPLMDGLRIRIMDVAEHVNINVSVHPWCYDILIAQPVQRMMRY